MAFLVRYARRKASNIAIHVDTYTSTPPMCCHGATKLHKDAVYVSRSLTGLLLLFVLLVVEDQLHPYV